MKKDESYDIMLRYYHPLEGQEMKTITATILEEDVKPFLKWPGGKQWLVKKYFQFFPQEYNTYYEPFLGGASVFFAMEPKKAVLSDINKELVNLFKVMRDYPEDLSRILLTHNENHSKEYYYQIRNSSPRKKIEMAARTLYLNRTCFNGIYRVNKKGEFNVPIGTKTDCIYDIESFEKYSKLLKASEIHSCDFSRSIKHAQQNDFVFADPPYSSSTQDGCFIKYNDTLFSWDDQLRLHKDLCSAKDRGVFVALTNKDNIEIEQLYSSNGFFITRLNRQCCIPAKKETTSTITELFITSYDLRKEHGND